mmetsp:Transcript_18410/g.28722  ORF Transcript_18410/g.28722 Transcript_18410/m.28722 type:complete len:96 (+) Transcript_18410:661-948(+)
MLRMTKPLTPISVSGVHTDEFWSQAPSHPRPLNSGANHSGSKEIPVPMNLWIHGSKQIQGSRRRLMEIQGTKDPNNLPRITRRGPDFGWPASGPG